MSSTEYIYALCEPSNDAVRYVGRSGDPKMRRKQHVTMAKRRPNTKKNKWIIRLSNSGMEPKVRILEEVESEKAGLAERRWVEYYLNRDRCLFNSIKVLTRVGPRIPEGSNAVKISQSFSIEEHIIQQVKEKADTHPYMNASNIVEQAIKEWLENNKEE